MGYAIIATETATETVSIHLFVKGIANRIIHRIDVRLALRFDNRRNLQQAAL